MNLFKAILHYAKGDTGGGWACGDTYETLQWFGNKSKPTKQDLENAWNEIKEQVAWEPIREERNKLLQESDWTQLQDSSADKAAWALYRQKLRDITTNNNSPESVVWPEKP